MNSSKYFLAIILLSISRFVFSQEVPILNYSIDTNNQVQIEVASSIDNYYILNIRHSPSDSFEQSTSMTMGNNGTTVLSESLEAYPPEYYQILEYSIASPIDTDGDGVDDITEFFDMPTQGSLNFAEPVDFEDGTVTIDSFITFNDLSFHHQFAPSASFLEDRAFLKYIIIDFDTDNPKLYFINSKTHSVHLHFIWALGIFGGFNPGMEKGEIIYHPTTQSNNGTDGVFSFNYSFGYAKPFTTVQKTQELIAANMPFLKNNLSYFITENNELGYLQEKSLFDSSRVSVLFESNVYEDLDYLALNTAEGYGFFRLMTLDETPNSKDVVLYESLPNTLPRVGGIMTSFIQTPLSHVNLRAIQNNLPNAFIRDPLLVDSIANLLGKYVYFKVEEDNYFIREASVDEVNAWFEDIRPDGIQIPALNLSYTSILPLDDINFNMSDGFGAKCANIATMRTFDFPEGTIPDGYGVPFYFYQEFMEYNGFFDEIETILSNPNFQSDLDTRIQMLKDLRSDIKAADMPQWMLDKLQTMHESFPDGTSIRCRSSTNNEDLPGFSGAGLYTSKTQHPDEGHISKSIKQVYASMWNFRAYDERDFYRIDQYIASMGVLCHPNYSNEKANGVGISTDPIYETDSTFYLNTQLGENLVTNPDALSTPEEILLDQVSGIDDDYLVIRYSNLINNDSLIMGENYLDEIRDYLTVIHDEFQILYDAEGIDEFAMDIEYKITSNDQLIIKQARPWASFWSELEPITSVPEISTVDIKYFPNPVGDYLNIQCDCDVGKIEIFNLIGQNMLEQVVDFDNVTQQIKTSSLPQGIYILNGIGENSGIYFTEKFVKE